MVREVPKIKLEISNYTIADDIRIKTDADFLFDRMIKVSDGLIFPREAHRDIEMVLERMLAYGRNDI